MLEPVRYFTGEKYFDCQKTYYFYKGVDMGSKDLRSKVDRGK